jgi:RNA-directed DNA polymerase
VIDADISGFFDAIDHEWMIRFIEHRIADKRVVIHVKKWLKAGVLEDETWRAANEGTPQGGCISPLLANIYLHYVLDLWVDWWRTEKARGNVKVVRFADDVIFGFQYKDDAVKFLRELKERLSRFSLELHPEKTRLIEFGPFANENRRRKGIGKPETFDFLGFTHMCGRNRKGKCTVRRKTIAKRLRKKLKYIKKMLRVRMHWTTKETGKWLKIVLLGHYRYYAVPHNFKAIKAFRNALAILWKRVLQRRSQKKRMNWNRFGKLVTKWLPQPRIMHPYPSVRLGVYNQGRSPVR